MGHKLLPKQYAKVLYALTVGKSGKELESAIAAFVLLLKKHQMSSKVNYIVEEFVSFVKAQEGIKELKVHSASKLSKEQLKSISRAWGGKTEIENEVDAELLGGILVKDGNKILDGSARANLQKLNRQLANG